MSEKVTKNDNEIIQIEDIKSKIYTIRCVQVMLDSDIAELYGVEVRVLNQAVKRNKERFPEDFMFQLTKKEYEILSSQIATLKKGRGKHRKYLPYAFIEGNKDVYHIGASLKDLDKKVFAFSKINKEGLKIMERLKYDR